MNIVLWILQILLAAAFAAHGWMMVAVFVAYMRLQVKPIAPRNAV